MAGKTGTVKLISLENPAGLVALHSPRLMYAIGEFSRRTGLSIRALRFYDREGILRPALVDEDTGYRYYQPTQLLDAEKIVFYRNCDLPVKTIGDLLKAQAVGDDAAVLSILESHADLLRERTASMQRMQRWLRNLRLEQADGSFGAEGAIEVIEARPRTVVVSRGFGGYDDVFPLIEELIDFALSQADLKIDGHPMLLWGEAIDADRRGGATAVEVAVPVNGRFRPTTELLRRKLNGGPVARLVFRGPRSGSGVHYERLFSWIFENGCQITGGFREIFLNSPRDVEEEDYLTELQVPVLVPEDQDRTKRAR